MNSVVLFNSPIELNRHDFFEMNGSYPRIGVASIAAYLLERDIDVKIIDPKAERLDIEKVKDIIKRLNPEIVGIHAFTEEIHDAAYTAKIIKETNSAVTVIGGPHASAIPVETLREFNYFDIAVFGEGELTFYDIVSKKNIEDVSGIAFRQNGNVKINACRSLIPNLDLLPFPAWQLYDLNNYKGGSLVGVFDKKGQDLELPIESARGCPFDCIFCYRMCGRTIRFKSPEKVADEAERNIIDFEVKKIHFIEGTFGVNKDISKKTCAELIRRRVHERITWSGGGRANVLDKELLSIMKKSGCVYLGFGVESGDDHMLKMIRKGITTEQIEKIFELCKDVGIRAEANFIIGHPYDTEETVLKTIKFAKKLKADFANFAILVPFPGTDVRNMAEKGIGGLKILSNDWRLYGKQAGGSLELEQLPLEMLISLQTNAYKEFYLRPSKFLGFVSRLSLKRIYHGTKRWINHQYK